ncbi:hypothetical protein ACSBR2_037071 [Camellia fascicularis]
MKMMLDEDSPFDDEFHKFLNLGKKLGLSFAFVPANNTAPHDHHDVVSTQQPCNNQQDKDEMIEKFKHGSLHLLVSTNLRDQIQPNLIDSTDCALVSEHERIQRCNDLAFNETNQFWDSDNETFLKFIIAKKIQQIVFFKQSIKAKADELIYILNKSLRPRSIVNLLFAKQILALCEKRLSFYDGFAPMYAQVIVLVTSKLPHSMDFFIAELNRLCIYTVPKHRNYLEFAFESKEAFYRTVGYKEQDGKIESDVSYLERLANYMRLYGALVQTEVKGAENWHGIMHGWAWLVRFLMGLPANVYTAVALEAFLSMAGYKLHKKYKIHFIRMMSIVSEQFLEELKREGDQKAVAVLARIQKYIEGREFLQEPEGCRATYYG